MLLFIRQCIHLVTYLIKFQYISCYCLSQLQTMKGYQVHISIHLMLLFIALFYYTIILTYNFNTSHVTVYHNGDGNANGVHIFQYISCYCLSKWTEKKRKYLYKFQYISCYCLSWSFLLSHKTIPISIHLMLLFIMVTLLQMCFALEFQYISCYCLSLNQQDLYSNEEYFNTSHVTVYHMVRIN